MDGGALSKDTVVVTGAAVTPGSVSVTLSLIKVKEGTTNQVEDVAGSAYTFNISAVALNEVKNAMIEDIDLHQASNSSVSPAVSNKVEPEVTGIVDGKKVTLVPGKDYEIVTGTDVVPDASTLEKSDSIGKAKVSVILKGSGQVITKEYEYSKATPVLTTAELKRGITITGSSIVSNGAVKSLFDLKDQYGNDFSSKVTNDDVFVTFSNLPEKVEAKNNGFTSAYIEAGKLQKDDVITIKVVFGKSKVVFEGDVKVH